MKSLKYLTAALALAACSTPVPDSGAGVGFGDYSEYVRQREAAQQGAGQPLTAVTPAQPVFSTETAAAAIDNAEGRTAVPTGRVIGQDPASTTTASPAGTRPRGGAPIGIKEESGEMRRSTGISDEQDFSAVAARETIESDAERLARQRAQYEVVAPTALPQRSGDNGPNIVQFALATTHAPGTQMYKRGSLFQKDPLITCAKYASPDLAQEAFLAKGGPDKDREGLDPDGDGFACGWDPRPFRNALR
ncbi:hypothetical protein EGN72_15710 [Pseudorhodobacter sp. E13]|uniref:hypothetical protein n=1 Tax=Pseudorhodobacter sp. E13 TaxID=2487931 RepID=UPI000F8F3F39|nr:hypothetical protein [Pseudorhodobacter sp. E13]RUS59374.1 hypothetical protein EGN72_15710 [Pseudorhodobacter sp. E13]